MTASRQTRRAQVCKSLAFIITATAVCLPLVVNAQEAPKRNLHDNRKAWKVNVVSDLFPEKQILKLQASVEEGWLVCRSGGSAVLEIPLNAITRTSRDSAKDYPVAEFLMAAATQPSTERHRFGSKKYREEMAARMMLGGIAIFTLLFPRHQEEVRVFWTDDEGEHGAEFLLGRKEGRAMLQKLQQETGVITRDLEKERKDYEQKRKELQRWIQKHGTEDRREKETPQSDHPAC